MIWARRWPSSSAKTILHTNNFFNAFSVTGKDSFIVSCYMKTFFFWRNMVHNIVNYSKQLTTRGRYELRETALCSIKIRIELLQLCSDVLIHTPYSADFLPPTTIYLNNRELWWIDIHTMVNCYFHGKLHIILRAQRFKEIILIETYLDLMLRQLKFGNLRILQKLWHYYISFCVSLNLFYLCFYVLKKSTP